MTESKSEQRRTYEDPLIDELRAIRERLWRESGENLAIVAEQLRRIERQNPSRLVLRSSEPPPSERRSA
ncbi:MAG TPA: hypothetical protein PLU35_12655 [Phycisphaerales bacterium]|nr:hypothetical protein [Phycisphaerales bacterium]